MRSTWPPDPPPSHLFFSVPCKGSTEADGPSTVRPLRVTALPAWLPIEAIVVKIRGALYLSYHFMQIIIFFSFIFYFQCFYMFNWDACLLTSNDTFPNLGTTFCGTSSAFVHHLSHLHPVSSSPHHSTRARISFDVPNYLREHKTANQCFFQHILFKSL